MRLRKEGREEAKAWSRRCTDITVSSASLPTRMVRCMKPPAHVAGIPTGTRSANMSLLSEDLDYEENLACVKRANESEVLK